MKQFVIEYEIGDGCTYGVTVPFHFMAESKEEIFVKINDAIENYKKVLEESKQLRKQTAHDFKKYREIMDENPEKDPHNKTVKFCEIGDFKFDLEMFNFEPITEDQIMTLDEYLTQEYNQNIQY